MIARIRGEATEALLWRCQTRVLEIVAKTCSRCVLYDLLEAHSLSADAALSQVYLDEGGAGVGLRRAIVVPDSHLAYMARLAFGGSDHRIFYSDIAGAFKWLEQEDSPCADDPIAAHERQESSVQAQH